VADVVYRFIASGQDTVAGAFRSIHKAALDYGKAVEGSYGRAERAAERTSRAIEKRGVSPTERLAQQVERDQTRAAKRKADTEAREAKRSADAQIREADRAEREKQRMAARAERERVRLVQQQARLHQQSTERARRERAETLTRLGKSTFDIGGGAVLTGSTLAIGLATGAARDALRTQELANRISINARKRGQDFVDPTALRREFEATAQATPGIGAADVADAVQRFIALTGDVDTARRGQSVFATVASATGSNVGDVAEAAASISQQFDIKGLEDMKDVLAALTFQGKEGAFELRDAAAQFQRLAASGAAFGIPKTVQGVKTLGGITQIARTGTGSAEQATTAVENLLTQFKAKSGVLASKYKVDVFRDGKARPIEDLIVETIAKVGGGDIAKKQAGLTSVFGEQGIRAINPLVSKYNTTYQETSGTAAEKTAAGMAVLRGELEKAINAAGTYADVQRDAAQAQRDASAKLTVAWEKVTAQAADQIVPALIPLVGEIPKLTGALRPAIESLGLFAKGLVAMVQYLQDIGVIDKPTRQEEYAQVKRESDLFEATIDPMQMTKAQIATRKQFREKLAQFDVGGAKALFEKAGDVKDIGSKEDFAKRMAEAEGLNVYTDKERVMAYGALYDRILANPSAEVADAQGVFWSSYSDKGQDVIGRYADQVTAGRVTNAGAPSGAEGVSADGVVVASEELSGAMADLVQKVTQAASAMERLSVNNRASTLNPGGS
jgi:hypothetical protein